MPVQSKQESYSANLSGTRYGTALRHPVVFRENSGRVGDVYFIDQNGNCRWIRNAFDKPVRASSCWTVELTELRAWKHGVGQHPQFQNGKPLSKRESDISKLLLVEMPNWN